MDGWSRLCNSAFSVEKVHGSSEDRLCASNSAKRAVIWAGGLGGLAELDFLMLLEIVHVEIAVGLQPILMGLDGEGTDEAAAGI